MPRLPALLALLAFAAPDAGEAADRPMVSAEAVGDVYVVRASFALPPSVNPEVAWAVLTDYGHIGQFVESVRESRVVQRDGGGVLVEQEVQGKLLMFSRTAHVLLRVVEGPRQTLEFEDLSRKDFELYRGSWALGGGPGALTVSYVLRAKPRHGLPVFVGSHAIDDGVAQLLQGLRAEMVARAAAGRALERTGTEQAK